jgi:hypothetical protein
MAGIPYGDPENAVAEGRFHLLPVIAVNSDDQSVTIAGQLQPGMDLFWALRKPKAAADDMAAMLTRMTRTTPQNSAAFRPDVSLHGTRPDVLRRRRPRPENPRRTLSRPAVHRFLRQWRDRPFRRRQPAAAIQHGTGARLTSHRTTGHPCSIPPAIRFAISSSAPGKNSMPGKPRLSDLEKIAVEHIARHPEYHAILASRSATSSGNGAGNG